jgi:hypothetical protein
VSQPSVPSPTEVGVDVALEVYRRRLVEKEDEIVALQMTLHAREQEIVRLQNALSTAHVQMNQAAAPAESGSPPAPAAPDVPSAP